MSNSRKRFIKKLEDFLNKYPEYLISRSSILGFYTLPPGKCNIKIAMEHLRAECQIEIVEKDFGYQVLIDEQYARVLEDRSRRGMKYYCLMALFFFHELHHAVEQGVGMKHTITSYRNTGYLGEFIVAQLDIKADRAAVVATKHFLHELSEVQIAKIQSDSLEDFPTVKGYSAESLWRKNRRFVANRLQYLALKHNLYKQPLLDIGNFIFATWNHSESEGYFDFVLTMFGSSMQHLGMARLTPEEYEFLDNVTFECESSALKFKRLDKLLVDILGRLHFGRSEGVIPRAA